MDRDKEVGVGGMPRFSFVKKCWHNQSNSLPRIGFTCSTVTYTKPILYSRIWDRIINAVVNLSLLDKFTKAVMK